MRAFHEDALICDFAETYHILDYQALPVRLQATLAAGLREGSRTSMAMSGSRYPLDTLLTASIADTVRVLLWSRTKDAQHNRNRPEAFLPRLIGQEEKKEEMRRFRNGADFDAAWKRLAG